MDYERKRWFLDLDMLLFKDNITNLSKEEKNELLFFIIDTLGDYSKFKCLLENGASARQFIGDEKTMMWTIAFTRDVDKNEGEQYLPILIQYIFNNFTEEFKEKSNKLIQTEMNKYKAIIRRSDMAYSSVGYESKNIQTKLDKEFEKILSNLAESLMKLNKKQIKIGDWIESKNYGESVCIDLNNENVQLRYEAIREFDKKIIWVENTDSLENVTYLREKDELSEYVLTLSGAYGEIKPKNKP